MKIDTEFLFDLELQIDMANRFEVGQLPLGVRTVVPVNGGSFNGPTIEGSVLPGGADWVLVEPDGSFRIDVRLNLQTKDEQNLYMNYQGFFHASKEVLERYYRRELLDDNEYYLRTSVRFETSSAQYGWLNHKICIAKGRQTKTGVIYSVYQVL